MDPLTLVETGLTLNAYGSWTVKKAQRKRGAEADECCVLGARRPRVPHLAIADNGTAPGQLFSAFTQQLTGYSLTTGRPLKPLKVRYANSSPTPRRVRSTASA